ncbi:MAG: alpha/beta hydrolase [Cocleimonas sp.]
MKSVEDYINLKSVTPNYRLEYGKHPEQFGNLYLPKHGDPYPTIILLHGGCWRAKFGLSQLGSLCKALTNLGFAVWNMEYRRLGNGGGWPTTFEDVSQGTDFLATIADKYNLDLSNVTAMGHSAGGHLALWLAGRHHLPSNSKLSINSPINISNVISLAGIPDLVEGVKQNICLGACQELVGGLPEEVPERYRQASPGNLLPLNISQWHLVGEQDPIVPVSYIQTYIEKAQYLDKVHFEIIPDIGHFEMVMPDTASWKYINIALSNS